MEDVLKTPIAVRVMRSARWCVWTRCANSSSPMCVTIPSGTTPRPIPGNLATGGDGFLHLGGGEVEFNEGLRKRRARAVVAALSQDHAIAAERRTPLGASFMAPVSTNSTEEGRSLNRRVELVAR